MINQKNIMIHNCIFKINFENKTLDFSFNPVLLKSDDLFQSMINFIYNF